MSLEVIMVSYAELEEPVPSAAQEFLKLIKEVDGSKTAESMIGFLKSSALNVGVLIVNKSVDSMYMPPVAFAAVDALEHFTGGIAILNVTSIMKIKGISVPLGVSLMHELGHAKQYIEDAKGFVGNFEKVRKDLGKASTEAKLTIENDNIQRHEMPICQELKCPFRAKYD